MRKKKVTVEGGEDDLKVTKTENNSMIFDCTYRAQKHCPTGDTNSILGVMLTSALVHALPHGNTSLTGSLIFAIRYIYRKSDSKR